MTRFTPTREAATLAASLRSPTKTSTCASDLKEAMRASSALRTSARTRVPAADSVSMADAAVVAVADATRTSAMLLLLKEGEHGVGERGCEAVPEAPDRFVMRREG